MLWIVKIILSKESRDNNRLCLRHWTTNKQWILYSLLLKDPNLSIFWIVNFRSYMHKLLHRKKHKSRMQSWCGNKYCMISWSVTLSKGNNKRKKFHNSGQWLHTKICSMIVYQQWWICPWGSLETKEALTTKRFRYLILRHQTRKISWTNIHWLQPSLRIQSFANRYRVMRSFLSPK